jgi:hypothetical protein
VASELVQDGNTIRIDMRIPWYSRLIGLPLLAFAIYLLSFLLQSLKDVFLGLTAESDDLPGQLWLVLFVLVFGAAPVMWLLIRGYLIIDKDQNLLTSIRQFGFLKLKFPRKLSEFTRVTTTWERVGKHGNYFNINLCGNKGTKPVLVEGSFKREDAENLAKELARAIGLPYEDYVDTEPEEDEEEELGQDNEKS